MLDPEGFPIVEYIDELHAIRPFDGKIEPGRGSCGVEKNDYFFAFGSAGKCKLLLADEQLAIIAMA